MEGTLRIEAVIQFVNPTDIDSRKYNAKRVTVLSQRGIGLDESKEVVEEWKKANSNWKDFYYSWTARTVAL